MIVLKAKTSLKGKDKLAAVSSVLRDPQPPNEPARFKRDEPLKSLSADEIVKRIEDLLGESPDTILAVVKVDRADKDGLAAVAHHLILLANEVLTKQTPMAPTKRPAEVAGFGDVVDGSQGSPLAKRVQVLEHQVQEAQSDHSRGRQQVDEVLRQVRAMAKRVCFQGPTHLIEALTYLVECATNTAHKDKDLFASALAVTKAHEDDPEVGQLVLSILGSDADRKVAEAKQRWLKSKSKTEAPTPPTALAVGPTRQPFQHFPQFPFTLFPPFPGPVPYRPRSPQSNATCLFCSKKGHVIRDCEEAKRAKTLLK